MLVIDTSALLDYCLADPPNSPLHQRINDDGDLHAPHLMDVEAVHALRRMVLADELAADRATSILREIARIDISRYSHEPLRVRMWDLRANFSAYDATFVALAEMLHAPLVTSDGRLSRATGHSAVIEDFSPPS